MLPALKMVESGQVEGRLDKKRRSTRAKLLEAAHQVITTTGVDASKIKDVTELADVGYGTFYNFFESKDDLASQVLDCVISDLGRRNAAATRGLAERDPALVMPSSIRLVLRTVIADPLWQWWALRPDLLFDRMDQGFGPFGRHDMREAVKRGIFHLEERHIQGAWRQSIWLMVAGIHEGKVNRWGPDDDSFVAESTMRMMGVPADEAKRLSNAALPPFPEPNIDWGFVLKP